MRPSIALLLSASLVVGCQDECHREGCDALTKHASGGVIAGVVASETDVVLNDCQECSFAQVPVRAWQVDTAPPSDAELSAVVMNPADAEANSGANGRFRLDALAGGPLVVCVGSITCFDLEAIEGATTTLNVRLINGVSNAFVGASGQSLERVEARLLTDPIPPENE